MVWFSYFWFGLVWFGLAWLGLAWGGLVWLGLVWFDLVWFGLVWFGLVWFGLAWFGLAWFDLAGGPIAWGLRRNIARQLLLSRGEGESRLFSSAGIGRTLPASTAPFFAVLRVRKLCVNPSPSICGFLSQAKGCSSISP